MSPDLTVSLLSNDEIPGWLTQLFAVCVGGAITLLSTMGMEWRRARKESKQLALAICAEVDASLRMVRFRKFILHLDDARKSAEAGEIVFAFFEMGDDYLPVTRNAASNLGALSGTTPYLLAELLTLVRSLKIDLDDLADPSSEVRASDSVFLAQHYRDMMVILQHAMDTGEALIAQLQRHYKIPEARPWGRS